MLAKLPLLIEPKYGEILYVYLSVGERTVSYVLIREERGLQLPIYYANKLLKGADIGYSKVEKRS